MGRRAGVLAGLSVVLAAAVGVPWVASAQQSSSDRGKEPVPVLTPVVPDPDPAPSPDPTPVPEQDGQVLLSFGGDVHFAGSSAAGLSGDLGTAFKPLRKADLAVVNLETAITERGVPEPKEYTFRAPAKALRVLKRAGVDVVTVANNHGMDYGQEGLADTLAAGRRVGLPIIGAGQDVTEAFTPFRTTVNGVDIAVIGATDVLDSFAVGTWTATDTRPGLASAKEGHLLADAVRRAAAESDVVVVVLHWGVETQSCPTVRQQELAAELRRAGAQVIVGSHAHVLEPYVEDGRTAIHYGLGNFVFYATKAASIRSGVFNVVVDRDGVVETRWRPARISGGRPQLLTGPDVKAARVAMAELAEQCGVA